MASELTGSKSSRKFRADIEVLRGEEKPMKCRTARIYSRISAFNYTKNSSPFDGVDFKTFGRMPTYRKQIYRQVTHFDS